MAPNTKRILVVEDDMIIAMVLEKMVNKLNFEVAGTAATGNDAIKQAKSSNPDLILMDIILKDSIDGISAMNEIRKWSDVPVIYLTGNSDEFNIKRASETGYIDYLVKPVQMKDLKTSIKKALT